MLLAANGFDQFDTIEELTQYFGLTPNSHYSGSSVRKKDIFPIPIAIGINISLDTINLYQFELIESDSTMSMNSLVQKAYNIKFVKILFGKLNSNAEFDGFFDIHLQDVQEVINLGQMKT